MYGTVAKLRLKPGMEAKMKAFSETEHENIDGILFQYLYRLDSDPQDLMLVVGFTDKAAYQSNAASPDQHARYEEYRSMLESDPEWHDGEILFSQTND